MAKLFSMHPSDDQLDLYLLGHLSQEEERFVEEHYFICPACLDRLSAIDEFIAVMRTAGYEARDPVVRRKPGARVAAILLFLLGNAWVSSAPAPTADTPQSMAAVIYERPPASTSAAHSRPKRIPHSHTLRTLGLNTPRTFQPPPAPLPAVAAEVLDVPVNLAIPHEWIEGQGSILAVEDLGPERPAPFESKPRWFRRVLLAMRRTFEPTRW